jgi:hypothetical protein
MVNAKSPQSMSITGSVLSGAQVAMAQTQGGQTSQSQQGSFAAGDAENSMTAAKVVELLSELEGLLKHSEVPAEHLDKASKYLDVVKDEVQEKEPDKELAAKNLQKMAQALKAANEATESGKKLWEKAIPVVGQLIKWFGITRTFLGLP